MEGHKTHISEKKAKLVERITRNIDKYSTIMICFITNFPSLEFQKVRNKLRDEVEIIVVKKRIVKKALEKSKKKNIEKLSDYFGESMALIFSNEDPFELALKLSENRIAVKAKKGQIPKKDIVIEAGPTDFPPGPILSELGKIGIKTKIENGKIVIKENCTVTKANTPISENVANVLSRLDIKPFKIGLEPKAAYDSKTQKIYVDIKIDKEETLKKLKEKEAKIFNLAIYINYITKDTIIPIIKKAVLQAFLFNNIVKDKNKEK